MKPKALFIISLIIILVISWANIVYFGYANRNRFSPLINQFAHCIFLTATCVIGYLNWKGKEKWISWLWLFLYGLVYLLVGILLLMYFYTGGHINQLLKVVIVEIRNVFTEPLPFLVFYILRMLTEKFSVKVRNG